MKPLTIAYVGNFGPRHSTENHVALSLRENGHTVVPHQEDALHRGEAGGWPGLADTVLGQGADLVLWTRTWQHERPEEQEQALLDLRAAGVFTASYHLDLYLGLDREEQIGREAFWRTDLVCTADGFLPDDEWAARFGVNHRWVRAGVLREECQPGTLNPQYVSDVAFVGSHRRYHDEWPYRPELLRMLTTHYGERFAKWPRGGRSVRNEALNDLYASAKVIVGDSLCVGFDRPRYWSDRVYETIGRGGFLIHPYIEGMEDEFTDGEHLRFYPFGDFAELRRLIDHYVLHDNERQAIAGAGQAHVREHCTYTHRTQELVGHVLAADPEFLGAGKRRQAVYRPKPSTRPLRVRGRRGTVTLRSSDDAEVFREVWDLQAYKAASGYTQGAVVVDVGANVGAFTLWALDRGARLVRSYEPVPGNFDQLQANVAKFGTLHVEPFNVAVGADAGELWLSTGPHDQHGSGSHTEDGPVPADWEERGLLRVPVVSVNDVLRSAIDAGGGEVGVWKLDVEGAEYGIIDGVEPDLLRCVRCLVMEFHGPGMPHLTHLQGAAQVGPLLARLAEYGRLDVLGRPSVGGSLTWTRY